MRVVLLGWNTRRASAPGYVPPLDRRVQQKKAWISPILSLIRYLKPKTVPQRNPIKATLRTSCDLFTKQPSHSGAVTRPTVPKSWPHGLPSGEGLPASSSNPLAALPLGRGWHAPRHDSRQRAAS